MLYSSHCFRDRCRVKKFMVMSNGLYVPRLRFLHRRLRKLKKLSQAHSRKKKGSDNRKKSAMKLARFHRKVSNTRSDFHHKLSHHLVKSHDVVVIEDLHIKGLIQNKKLSRCWADHAHGELKRMLTYKGKK